MGQVFGQGLAGGISIVVGLDRDHPVVFYWGMHSQVGFTHVSGTLAGLNQRLTSTKIIFQYASCLLLCNKLSQNKVA